MPRPRGFDADAVLDAAVQVFWRRGFEATSVEDLVAELGIGRQSLYATFGSKQRLYLRALERYCETQTAALVGLLALDGRLEPRLGTLLEGVVSEMVSDRDCKGCFVVNAAAERGSEDAETGRHVREQFARIEAALEAAFDRARADGELDRDADPRALARFVLAAVNGMRVVGKVAPEPSTLSDIASTTLAGLPWRHPLAPGGGPPPPERPAPR